MTQDTIMTIGREAMQITIMLAAPLLLTALAVGLLISILQAATQIQEMTLSFIPKLIGMVLALMVTGHWLLGVAVDFTRHLYQSIPHLIG